MPTNTLTAKQERFVQGLFTGKTQREAYKDAYSNRMTDKQIDEEACKLAAKPKVYQRLKELQDEIKERNFITVEKIIEEYAKIGFADIKDYLSFGMKELETGQNEDGEPIVVPVQTVNVKPSEEVDGTLISEVSINSKGVFTFKMHDKMNALEKMGRYLGMFRDKVEVTGKDGGAIEIDSPRERIERRIALTAARTGAKQDTE